MIEYCIVCNKSKYNYVDNLYELALLLIITDKNKLI